MDFYAGNDDTLFGAKFSGSRSRKFSAQTELINKRQRSFRVGSGQNEDLEKIDEIEQRHYFTH